MVGVFNRTRRAEFAIIDSQFPQKNPFGFRNAEINDYLRRIENVEVYNMFTMAPGPDAPFAHTYGTSDEEYKQNITGYLEQYPQNSKKIHHLQENTRYKFKLAYSFFLAETFVLLPFLEKNKIPFIFVLYPGGLFGLNSEASDNMLKKLFSSRYFRSVIVTQPATHKYLLDNKFCSERDINYIFGGFVQFNKKQIKPKQYYKKEKKTFDICFAAGKYSKKGIDKGYDLFIEAAKILYKQIPDARFHVIGGFDKDEIDVSELNDSIKFYGYCSPEFLLDFYSRIDVFLSPNRPYKLYDGNFDGFPLGGDAQYCGAALFASDELGLSKGSYIPGKDVVIVDLDARSIAKDVFGYYNNLNSLYELSKRGQEKAQTILDIDYLIEKRIEVFSKFVNIKPLSTGKNT